MPDTKETLKNRRGFIKAASAVTAAAGIGFPFVSRAQDKPIRIGMPTILSGRVAQLGISSRNAVHDGSGKVQRGRRPGRTQDRDHHARFQGQTR